MHIPRLYPTTIVLWSLVLSIASPVITESACEQEQEFIVSAYYSPLPNQDRYFLGSYEADIAFNGNGIAGKDGTPVKPGMLAAPENFPFGTRIFFPELNSAGTVHDRGGRIVTGEDGVARIDIWMGEGEEGLARALEWGVREVTGQVFYPKPHEIPEENFALENFPAPESALKHVPSNPIALKDIPDPRYSDTSSQVAAIQFALRQLGYFDHDITSFYGDVTRDALQSFMRDAFAYRAQYDPSIPNTLAQTGGSGEIANEEARNLLIAHRTLAEELTSPLPSDDILLQGTNGKDVRIVQRMLKILNLYDGELDGVYDQELMSTIFAFQKDRNLISSLTENGAGMIGPQTKRAMLTAWRDHRIQKRGGSTVVASL